MKNKIRLITASLASALFFSFALVACGEGDVSDISAVEDAIHDASVEIVYNDKDGKPSDIVGCFSGGYNYDALPPYCKAVVDFGGGSEPQPQPQPSSDSQQSGGDESSSSAAGGTVSSSSSTGGQQNNSSSSAGNNNSSSSAGTSSSSATSSSSSTGGGGGKNISDINGSTTLSDGDCFNVSFEWDNAYHLPDVKLTCSATEQVTGISISVTYNGETKSETSDYHAATDALTLGKVSVGSVNFNNICVTVSGASSITCKSGT